ncbi:helix-turn-helix domain-containing protein [Patescibacteria group bacterium]|nr:helix-turn-helix domain-containing protein [Patescibacteria group bacterium]
MRYSIGFKESQVKKILPPSNKSIRVVSQESGVSEPTLRRWLKKVKEGTLKANNTVHSGNRSAKEKLSLVIESKSLTDNDAGRWLREKGLHSEHITLYEQELRDMVEDKKDTEKQAIKKLQLENKRLEKDLKRSQAALAEMAALYTLKKKADAIWGDKEED